MTSTVDPVAAAQATLALMDPRWAPPGVPSASFEEMLRTVHEIEGFDLSVDYLREKAHRYLGWLQGAAEVAYGVPAETLREVNRGNETPPWEGYETSQHTGWYRRPLDGEPPASVFPLGFTDHAHLYVMSPASDPGRTPPHEETHHEIGIHVMMLGGIGIGIEKPDVNEGIAGLLARAAGGRAFDPGTLDEAIRGAIGDPDRRYRALEPASPELGDDVMSTVVRGLEGAPEGLREGVLEITRRNLAGERIGPAEIGEMVHRAIERDGVTEASRAAALATMERLRSTVQARIDRGPVDVRRLLDSLRQG